MAMDVVTAIKTRRSIRNYVDKTIEKADLEEILECGMYAPSAHNQQAWEFYVVQDTQKLQQLSEYLQYGKMLSWASAVVLVCFDTAKLKAPDFVEHDMGACMENMLLVAHSKGIGGVWVGIYPKNNQHHFLNTFCNIPEHIEVFSVLSLGYPDESVKLWEKKCVFPEKVHFVE